MIEMLCNGLSRPCGHAGSYHLAVWLMFGDAVTLRIGC